MVRDTTENGADDYLVKSFRLAELLARVRAVMRRGGKTLATKVICGDATDYVKGVIRRLRVKLEPDPAHPKYIITEPHLGYRLRDSL